jgi:hypothetical protein
LAGDLNAKHQFWNSAVSNPSGEKLLHIFDVNQFEISAPQSPTHYSPAGNGVVLDIVIHQNSIRVSDVIVSDILDADHLPVVFHILDHVKITNLSEPVEKFTDWDWFQSLASELMSPKVGGRSRKRGAVLQPLLLRRIGCRQVRLHFQKNNDLLGLDRLLKHKQRLRKLCKKPEIQHVKRQLTE